MPKSKNHRAKRNKRRFAIDSPERRAYQALVDRLPPEMRRGVAFDALRGEVVFSTPGGGKSRYPATPEALDKIQVLSYDIPVDPDSDDYMEEAKEWLADISGLIRASGLIRNEVGVDVHISYDNDTEEIVSKWPGVDEFRFHHEFWMPKEFRTLKEDEAESAIPFLFQFTHPMGALHWQFYYSALPDARKSLGMDPYDYTYMIMTKPECAEDSRLPLLGLSGDREKMIEDTPHEELRKEFIENIVPEIDSYPPAMKLFARHYVGVKI